jgi:hypothetical protein
MDMLKVTPYYRFMASHWGSKFHWENNDESPETVNVCVKDPEDWSKLWVLDPRKELREALRCVEILSRDLYGMPFIYTIPSPIVQALHGISYPQRVHNDMVEHSDSLKQGLEIITLSGQEWIKTNLKNMPYITIKRSLMLSEERQSSFFISVVQKGKIHKKMEVLWEKVGSKNIPLI